MRNSSRTAYIVRWLLIRCSCVLAVAVLSVSLPFLVVVYHNWGLENVTHVHEGDFHVTKVMSFSKAQKSAQSHYADLYVDRMGVCGASPIRDPTYLICASTPPYVLLARVVPDPPMYQSPTRLVRKEISLHIWEDFIQSRAFPIALASFNLGLLLISLGYREAYRQAREKYLQTVWPMDDDLVSEDYSDELVRHLHASVLATWIFVQTVADPTIILSFWKPGHRLH